MENRQIKNEMEFPLTMCNDFSVHFTAFNLVKWNIEKKNNRFKAPKEFPSEKTNLKKYENPLKHSPHLMGIRRIVERHAIEELVI